MASNFLSIVVPTINADDEKILESLLRLKDAFDDGANNLEVVLVMRVSQSSVILESLPGDLKNVLYVLRIAGEPSWDDAALAGLHRANGDWIITCDLGSTVPWRQLSKSFGDLQLNQGTQLVGMRDFSSAPARNWIRSSFFWALQRSGVPISAADRHEFVISRQAASWILQSRLTPFYLNEALVASGIKIDWKIIHSAGKVSRSRKSSRELAWAVVSRSPRLLRGIGAIVLTAQLVPLAFAAINAIAVRLVGVDVFLQPQTVVPGWTYTVVLSSLGFGLLSLLLFLLIAAVSTLIEQSRARPPYVITSHERI